MSPTIHYYVQSILQVILHFIVEMLFFGRGKDKESTALGGGGGGGARLRAEEYIAFKQSMWVYNDHCGEWANGQWLFWSLAMMVLVVVVLMLVG